MLLLLVGTAAADTPIAPDPLGDAETVSAPALRNTFPITPTGIGETETLGAPAATFVIEAYDGTYGSGAYGVGKYGVMYYEPTGIAQTETLGTPTVTANYTILPGAINDTDVPGGPTLTVAYISRPTELSDAETFGAITLTITIDVAPNGITDTDALADPTATLGVGGEPATITEPETLGTPDALFAPLPPFPDGITDTDSIGTPSALFHATQINPDGITDTQTLGDVGYTFTAHYNGSYGSGVYGAGPYQGMVIFPDNITDWGLFNDPALSAPAPIPPNQVLPFGITDAETLGEPELPRPALSNYAYGAGIYGDGIYEGAPVPPGDNPTYGSHTYGYGIYFGILEPLPPDEPPYFADILGPDKPPLHILGIGPWSSSVPWRGAPNYGIAPGPRTPHPVLALPPATSKSFTLRLGDGGEARLELSFSRGSAIVLDEMDTDLWWRRKDPRTGKLEMIGRFNVSHNNMATSDTGINCSVQLDDYQTVLGNRCVLKYLNPKAEPDPTTMWAPGTPIISIIAWALPDNTGLDLSEAKGPTPYDLGRTTRPFDLPPDTTMETLFDNLRTTASPKDWEWWIDTPDDVTKPPKLRFIVGQRGNDKGVTLFDVGKGPSPIAAWTRNTAESDYANSLYYTGGTPTGQKSAGGIVEQIDAQIDQYGQRDHVTGNSTIDGSSTAVLKQHANALLGKLSDRRPNYQITLRQGYWRGRSHIDVGDVVTVVLRLGQELLQDKYRVSEITVSIDDVGLEDVSLTLGRLPVSADPRSKRSPLIRIVKYLKNYVAPNGSADIEQPD